MSFSMKSSEFNRKYAQDTYKMQNIIDAYKNKVKNQKFICKFSQELSVLNKNNFKQMNYDRVLCILYNDIYEHMISEDENSYFDLDIFCKKHLKNNTETMNEMITVIINDLSSMGWNCKKSFGDTGLFIYSTSDPPPSCYPDEF